MRRFNFEDDDFEKEEVERFLDESQDYLITPEEYQKIIEDEIDLYDKKLEVLEQKTNYTVLRFSAKLLEKSFWWKFYSLDTKLKYIKKTFNELKSLIKIDIEK